MSRIFNEKCSKLSDRAQPCCWRAVGIICWRSRKKNGKTKIIREETQDGKIGKKKEKLLICKLFSYGLCIIFIFNFRETLSKQQSHSNLNNALMFYVRITVLCKRVKLNCLFSVFLSRDHANGLVGLYTQTSIFYIVLHKLTETSIYPQLNSPTAQIRTNKTRSFSVGKLVLLNIFYHLHEPRISLIEFRFTLMSFWEMLLFFIDVIEFQFNGIINKVLLMNFSLTLMNVFLKFETHYWRYDSLWWTSIVL